MLSEQFIKHSKCGYLMYKLKKLLHLMSKNKEKKIIEKARFKWLH